MKVTFMAFPMILASSQDMPSMNIAPRPAIYLLAAVLINAGHDVNVVDPLQISQELKDKNLKQILISHLFESDIVCISSNTIDWPSTVVAIKYIREIYSSRIMIVLGGIHPTYFYKYIMKTHDVDFILRGDGELGLPKLIKAIENNNGYDIIQGLVQKGCILPHEEKLHQITPIDFHSIPLPAFELLPKNVYSVLPIETSRGCKFNCAFCSVPYRNSWMPFNEDDVINKCSKVIEDFGMLFITKQVFITDDCLTADFSRAAFILSSLICRHPEHRFIVETRITDWITPKREELVSVFKHTNIMRLAFGIECGYNIGLKHLSKALTIEEIEQVLCFLEEHSLMRKSFFSFIIGFPWESVDDCVQTIDYAASIASRFGSDLVNINWLEVFPSRIWNDRETYNIKADAAVFDTHVPFKNLNFHLFHPNIDESAKGYIENTIETYENKGIFLRTH